MYASCKNSIININFKIVTKTQYQNTGWVHGNSLSEQVQWHFLQLNRLSQTIKEQQVFVEEPRRRGIFRRGCFRVPEIRKIGGIRQWVCIKLLFYVAHWTKQFKVIAVVCMLLYSCCTLNADKKKLHTSNLYEFIFSR